MLVHGFKQVQRIGNVVAVIPVRLFYRLADLNKGSKVNDPIEAMAGENPVENRLVAQIAFNHFAAENRIAMAGREIIENGNGITAFKQQFDHVGAYVAGPA